MDTSCHTDFEKIKKYLSNRPILGIPIPGETLILYIATQERSPGTLYVQKNEGKEISVYYLIHTLVAAELRYSPVEKIRL